MAFIKLPINEFLQHAKVCPVIDVRSPGEYNHAHIPQAYSLPLFTDEERKIVGTAYKQENREKAIKHGLEFFGPKMVKMVEEVEQLTDDRCKMTDVKGNKESDEDRNQSTVNFQLSTFNSKTVLVHCWRGGMRSGAVAWLLDLYGFEVYVLDGGYKEFRNWVLQQFQHDYAFKILGGYTGSGKTELLAEMKKQGEIIIDLEALANHKGSAFGGIGKGAQPSTEMFENMLALELSKADDRCKMTDDRGEEEANNKKSLTKISDLSTVNSHLTSKTIWLEDESQRIGNINIPNGFWATMRKKPVVFINIPFEERLDNIIKGYGTGDKEKLIDAVMRITKRLGGLETIAAINFLREDNYKEGFRILLSYYDKWYKKGLYSRENFETLITQIEINTVDAALNCKLVLLNKREEHYV